ncbi:MAG: hypothetical protein HQK75_16810 [Candidatus Magnetomorum sp.]|nr:hypothetical protein [Candidatus Magnetomorum sp.]
MKRLVIQLFSVFLMMISIATTQVFADDSASLEKSKTWCISLIGKSFTDASEVKSLLLDRSKNAVIDDLFEQIVLNSNKTPASMQKAAVRNFFADSVTISPNVEYKNGNQFGEACITIQAHVSNETILQFRPFKIKKSYCFFDDNITLKTLKLKTKQQAILQALYDYDERLRGKKTEDVLGLAHNIEYVDTGFSSTEEKYCVDVTFEVSPAEINIFKKDQMNEKLSLQKAEPPVQSELYPYLEATVSTQLSIRQGSVQRLIERITATNQDEILHFFLERIESMMTDGHENGIYNASVILANLDNRVLVQGKNQIKGLYDRLKGNESEWKNTLVQLRAVVDRLNN